MLDGLEDSSVEMYEAKVCSFVHFMFFLSVFKVEI
jgi:hypothetical protein